VTDPDIPSHDGHDQSAPGTAPSAMVTPATINGAVVKKTAAIPEASGDEGVATELGGQALAVARQQVG
jgi:hypothetical protein